MSAADWSSQTLINYGTLSCMEMRFFSVVEIPIKHSSSHNKVIFYMRVLQIPPHQPGENNNDCLPDYFQDKPENSCLS